MQVILAKFAGACYGVQRALDMVDGLVAGGRSVSTIGPLIHNPQVVAKLEEAGVHVATSPEDIEEGTAVIRSHGVAPQVKAALVARGLEVADATCPHVARAQAAAAELAQAGCRVLVVGEAGHPEVEGLVACAKDSGAAADVVLFPEDIPQGLYDPVGVVVQTTQTRDNLDALVCALRAQGLAPQVKDTICSATRKRQKTAFDLASKVDAMVVIGGRNSSNTTRLSEICAHACSKTFHVESPSEVSGLDLQGCAVIGVTAGASTPEDQIEEAVRLLEAWEGQEER